MLLLFSSEPRGIGPSIIARRLIAFSPMGGGAEVLVAKALISCTEGYDHVIRICQKQSRGQSARGFGMDLLAPVRSGS